MKKVLSMILMAGLLMSGFTGMAAAAEDENGTTNSSYYLSITGTVVSMEEVTGANDDTYTTVNIEDENGNPVKLNVNEETVYPFEKELSVGDTVTGFYQANAPMPLIWPAQYKIAVLAAGVPEGSNLKVDRFNDWADHADDYMLAQGGAFAFKMNDDTEITLADGKDFTNGEIDGRRLVIIYSASTRSIPELTTAEKVIVLFEDIMPLPEETLEVTIDASEWPILVDGVEIDAPAAFQTDDGIVMTPLRAIAEALGFEVKWDGKTRTVSLDETTKLVIGDSGSVIRNDLTYVPLSYFKDELKMVNAFAFEGQIEIHSEGEIME